MNNELKDLVIARLDTLPSGMKISIGGMGSFTKSELIKNVNDETPIGEKIVKIHLTYIRSFIKD